MENPYKPKKYKIIRYTRESPDSFTLRINMKVNHDPGEFVQVTLPGIGECPISICSHSNKFMDLNIREVGNTTRNLASLKVGDTLLVRGPYGRGYPMQELKGNNIVIIGGGCGFAPLKGIVEYVDHKRKDFKDVNMFLGFRSPEDILFKTDIEGWEKKHKIHITVDKKPAKTCWDGRVGFVTEMLKKTKFKTKDSVVFICGPPIMMRACIDILGEKGFEDTQIYVSAERLMNCAIGICGHCMIHGKYTCIDGPVFRWDQLKGAEND